MDDNTPTDPTETVAADQSVEVEQTFDAEYVSKLRAEAAEYRVKAKRVDDLARQSARTMTQLDGRLIDVDDLAFDPAFVDEAGLVDSAKVTAAIDGLVERKPHLTKQRVTPISAQGARAEPERVDLHGILRSHA